MKILEEIKENLAEGRKSPIEEIYETRNGFLSFSFLTFFFLIIPRGLSDQLVVRFFFPKNG
jgi:hypothetical protein